MLRIKLYKLKQVCATALLPRIFKESKLPKKKIVKYSIECCSKVSKSTYSGSKDKDCEKQMRIIEKCFPEKRPESDIKHYNDDIKESLNEKALSSVLCDGNLEDKRTALNSKVFKNGESEEITNKVQATTAKLEEEKLTQKIDHIDETPHVEAGVSKIEGFNVTPRVLGKDTNTLDISEQQIDTHTAKQEQINLDELAKRCLSSPVGEIDQILLNELKNLSHGYSQNIKINLPTNDSDQKYFSQIFEGKTKNNTLISDISGTHMEQMKPKEVNIGDKGNDEENILSKFQPFHLDTVPIFCIDRYKDGFKKEYSPKNTESLLLDIPAVLDPYDMQAIPFYEYVNKENIILQDIPVLDAAAITETIQETENSTPMNEEVILQRDVLDKHDTLTNNEIKELEECNIQSADANPIITKAADSSMIAQHSTNPLEISMLSESDVSKLLEYKNVISTKMNVSERGSDDISNKFSTVGTDTQRVLTSTTEDPPPFGSNLNEADAANSAISNAYPTTNTKRTLELPENTAISANQKPEEYFELPKVDFKSCMETNNENSVYDDYRVFDIVITDAVVTTTGATDTIVADDRIADARFAEISVTDKIVADNNVTDTVVRPHITDTDKPITQNVAYTTMPQILEVELDSKNKSDSITNALPVYGKGPTAHLLLQPEPKHKGNSEILSVNPIKKDMGICSEDTIPLSILLQRVRERNRKELTRSVYLRSRPRPHEAQKKVTCVPPLDRSKPKTTLSPNPCQSKPKSPCKPECPSPCPPKKDPCAKFIPLLLNTIIKSDPSFNIPITLEEKDSKMYTCLSSLTLTKEVAVKNLKQLSQVFEFFSIKNNVEEKINDIVCARDFDPWIPIPSWPIPKMEKKRPLVCPKHGCKLPIRPIPSNTDKPCIGMPKKLSPTKMFFIHF